MRTTNNPEVDREHDEYLSDSSQTNSTFSATLLKERVQQQTRQTATNVNINRENVRRTFVVPKKSLSQYLERKSIFRKKTKKEQAKGMLSPRQILFQPQDATVPAANNEAGGDHIKHDTKANIQTFTAVGDSSEPQVFPFKSTPSGNYKLRPSQIVYESKNLSIVAADPTSVSLNITESEAVKDQEKKPYPDNWTTTCLYTTVGKGELAYSDLDTTSDSDIGGISSELSLAKMGYVTDNLIEWQNFCLPQKSDLKKVLLYNILNMINPDIQVKIGNKTHKCHRIVLQCYSSFFASRTGPQVELPETAVSSDVFSLIYKWMLHMGTDSYRLLKRDNILQIFKAAQFLGIKELEDQCWAFIDNVDIFFEDKAFLLYLEARRLNNKEVMDLMVPRIQRFFLTLVSSKEFVEFSADEVVTFLSSNYICVHCEEEVFMAAVRWLRHDWPQRKSLAPKIMSCVRFGLMNPKLLLAMRRDKSSPEFKPIISIPEVGKMVDDGLSIQILRLCFLNESPESIEKSKQNLNLEDPIPRNWAGTDRNYQSYTEFIKDLNHYRSKQRLEIKKSKIKLQMARVDKDDFLSSAVLPPDTQERLIRMHEAGSSLIDCMEQRDLNILRDMMREDDVTESIVRGRMKNKIVSMANEDIPYGIRAEKIPFRPNKKTQQYNVRSSSPTLEEKDEAARTIQRAYRRHSKHRSQDMTESAIIEDEAARKIQKAYRKYSAKKLSVVENDNRESNNFEYTRDNSLDYKRDNSLEYKRDNSLEYKRDNDLEYKRDNSLEYKRDKSKKKGSKKPWRRSRSDPSLPSGLTKSSFYPSGKYGTDGLPLQVEKTIFIFGGSNPFDDSDQNGYCVYSYNVECNEWRKCGEMPEPRHYHSVVYFQGKIYVAGGKHPSRLLSEPGAISRKVWRFDPQHRAWSRLKDMLYARRSFGLVGCNNKLYVVGGRNENDRIMANVEKLDSVSNNWVAVAPMHLARAGAAISDFKGKIWVAGGLIGDDTVATNTVEYYNCQHDFWTECKSLRYTLAYGVMVPVDNRIFLVGGAVGLQDSTLHGSGKQIDVWDEEAQTWCMAAMMSKPRHAHTAVYLRSSSDTGYMFIMGGMSTKHNAVTDHVECWRIRDEQWIVGVCPLPSPMSGSAALALPCGTFS